MIGQALAAAGTAVRNVPATIARGPAALWGRGASGIKKLIKNPRSILSLGKGMGVQLAVTEGAYALGLMANYGLSDVAERDHSAFQAAFNGTLSSGGEVRNGDLAGLGEWVLNWNNHNHAQAGASLARGSSDLE